MYRYVLSRQVAIPGDEPEQAEPDITNTPVPGKVSLTTNNVMSSLPRATSQNSLPYRGPGGDH